MPKKAKDMNAKKDIFRNTRQQKLYHQYTAFLKNLHNEVNETKIKNKDLKQRSIKKNY